jgi:superfamily I DNA/RNA helicase
MIALDTEQEAAVAHPGGPVLVSAGPGSGKTRVITERVRWLLVHGADPDAVAVVTFTVRAAQEMAERLGPSPVRIGTIHGLCWRLLQETYRGMARPVPAVLEHPETFARQIIDKPSSTYAMGLGLRHVLPVGQALTLAERAEDALLRDMDAELASTLIRACARALGRLKATPEQVARFYNAYLGRLDAENKIDFSGMYARLWWMWQDEPLLRLLHCRFDHLLIDEFQDTSYGQWQVLRSLLRTDNLYVVGDFWQSMYTWRGADPELERRLFTAYPDLTVYNVGTNYRSLPEIVEHSRSLMGADRQLRPHRQGTADIRVEGYDNAAQEAAGVVGFLRALRGAGTDWSRTAVLSRTGSALGYVELECIRHGIPCRSASGQGFFRAAAVADMVAYLALSQDHTDVEAFGRAIRAPNRFLGTRFVDGCAAIGGDLLAAAGRLAEVGGLNGSQVANVRAFLSLMEHVEAEGGAAGMLRLVRERTDYDRWAIAHRHRAEDGPPPSRVEELDVLEELAAEIVDPAQLVRTARNQREEVAEAVTLSTIHRAKGLEWEAVAVVGCEDGHMPHARGDPDEERRIAYVAMTRAKDRLLLTWSRWRKVGDSVMLRRPSPFLADAGL